mmetsp:Transcript_20874/g.35177  ORF Transcript_20874/g.35177 Transcript_20874/m.35177 type:complete len:563 (+) Transcript_20874:55-1743(+)
MLFSTAALMGLGAVSAIGSEYDAKVWNSKDSFPEQTDTNIMARPNTGIAFSGGGARSYLASTGYLAALNELGLMDNVRYVSGISGGNWATLGYMYAQNEVDDSVLLGPVVDPSEITEDNLNVMDSNCMRGVTDSQFVTKMVRRMLNGVDAGEAWMKTYQEVYLNPLSIPDEAPYSWSEDVVNQIKSVNPSLEQQNFVLPAKNNRPYSIVGTSNLGPAAGAPYEAGDNLNLTMLEMTPLYVGSMNTKEVDYKYHHGLTHKKTMGGVVEPFAYSLYDSSAVPRHGLEDDDVTDHVTLPTFKNPLDLAHTGGASSYAIGMFIDSLPEKLRTNLDYSMQYWSAVDKRPSSEETLFADGGCFENILVSSMLQRQVEKIVLFFNNKIPIQPASSWDVYNDEYTGEQVTDELAALFGVYPSDEAIWAERGYDYTHNQHWSTEDWYPLITGLQNAQQKGNGNIMTMNLTTIGNSVWNIPAGIRTEVTFVYLGRAFSWEDQLSPEMQALLVPSDPAAAADPSKTVDSGDFKTFPHYATTGGDINHKKANALADLTGWVVKKNADLFKSILS